MPSIRQQLAYLLRLVCVQETCMIKGGLSIHEGLPETIGIVLLKNGDRLEDDKGVMTAVAHLSDLALERHLVQRCELSGDRRSLLTKVVGSGREEATAVRSKTALAKVQAVVEHGLAGELHQRHQMRVREERASRGGHRQLAHLVVAPAVHLPGGGGADHVASATGHLHHEGVRESHHRPRNRTLVVARQTATAGRAPGIQRSVAQCSHHEGAPAAGHGHGTGQRDLNRSHEHGHTGLAVLAF
mmetsp:Transcript_14742/g.44244  ORF Transcript_14742/g.44244 Transcript_14742/m.44244 type:complete len:243 (+) Transcript_14742:738-1466(+)